MGESQQATHEVQWRLIGISRHVLEVISHSFKGAKATVSLFFILLFIGAVFSFHWVTAPLCTGVTLKDLALQIPGRTPKDIEIPLSCGNESITQTCPANYPRKFETESSIEACPEYFRWIHEDLRSWKETGITKDMVDKANGDFRLLIVKGKAYVQKFRGCYQTRDAFTIWGIVQLLRLYPGKIADLDLMFSCGDMPLILKSDYQGGNAKSPPPLFHYCKDDQSLDIVFPDWSFWGWPEINIKPWVRLRKELEEGNNRTAWIQREPYAYWKGNTAMGVGRRDLFGCNPTNQQDWNARIYHQDWVEETRRGFMDSNLASQCSHRYKIYIEGISWSVSEKYILACNSMTLLVNTQYDDIFTRGLLPLTHYWPIRDNDKCRSIKFAVDWGNNHTEEAQRIGMEGSKFIREKLKMSQVYDYMFHLLNEYAKLLKYQPTVPPDAVQVCSETMACNVGGLEKFYKLESMVKGPSTTGPCSLLLPYDPLELQTFMKRKENLTKQVELWELNGNITKVILGKS